MFIIQGADNVWSKKGGHVSAGMCHSLCDRCFQRRSNHLAHENGLLSPFLKLVDLKCKSAIGIIFQEYLRTHNAKRARVRAASKDRQADQEDNTI